MNKTKQNKKLQEKRVKSREQLRLEIIEGYSKIKINSRRFSCNQ